MLKIRVVKAMLRVTAAAAISLLVALSASAQTIRYVHTDGLGSVVLETDKDRNVLERSEYEPYGDLLNRAANDEPSFTGHVQDSTTNLVYMQQRYYDSSMGRFLSVDPVSTYDGPVDYFNRYWYGNNNPYVFVDPDGRLASDEKKDSVPPPKPTDLPPVTVTAPKARDLPVQALSTIIVIGIRSRPIMERIPFPVVNPRVGAPIIGIELLLYAPYPCLDVGCGEMPADQILVFAKGGRQNVKDSGLVGVSDEEIKERLRDPNTPASEKKRLVREEKGRKLRDIKKRKERR